ncbi:hypothetical protein [Wukongibacter sp. M2B1]|uniref:hypothetical protein n=1 Tax=Wukongibacter sp. M2B1 TaxID=3088895 RepID=UPI003D797738
MRSIKIKHYLLLCLICICISTTLSTAESRNIYIGDLITLEIKSQGISQEEIIDALKEFEIMEIEVLDDGYKVTLRSFETGEKTITIGDQDIDIIIVSTLDDIQREDIYEGDLTPRGGGRVIPWLIIYMVVMGIFIISGIVLLISKIKKRRTQEKSPYESFKIALELVDISDTSALVEMTAIFKQYIQEIFHCKIIGKTSNEIMIEVEQIEETSPYRLDIHNWLTRCDTYKFSGLDVKKEQIGEMRLDLMQIGVSIYEKEEVVI